MARRALAPNVSWRFIPSEQELPACYDIDKTQGKGRRSACAQRPPRQRRGAVRIARAGAKAPWRNREGEEQQQEEQKEAAGMRLATRPHETRCFGSPRGS